MDGFKADFIQYLRENNLLERVDLNKNDTNINAQKYDDQLKDFLQDYKVDENELVEASIDIDEILSMDFDDIANVEVNDNDVAQGKDVIGGLFNFLINQNDIKAQVDKNGDGKFSKDEINEFAKTVASKDGDDSNFTLKDMFSSYTQMQNKDFRVGDMTIADPVLTNDVLTQKTPSYIPETNAEIKSALVSSIDSSSLEGKNAKELSNERSAQEGALEQNQINMALSLSGVGAIPSNEEVNGAYGDYLAQVEKIDTDDRKYSEELSTLNGKITAQQDVVHTEQMQAEMLHHVCVEAEKEVEIAQNNLNSANAALESAKAEPIGQQPSAGAPLTAKNAYNAKVSARDTAIAEAQTKVDEAKAELKTKEEEKQKADEDYNKQVEVHEAAQNHLEELNGYLKALQGEIANVKSENQQKLQELGSFWNTVRDANEQSRQTNYDYYNQYANIAAENLGVIDDAIAQSE